MQLTRRLYVKTRLLRSSLVLATALTVGACNPDLSVTNPNNPDIDRVLAEPGDVVLLASGALRTWYFSVSHYYPNMFLQVTADAAAANYGNFGMRFNNEEPRIPFNNAGTCTAAGQDVCALWNPWSRAYSAIGAANAARGALDGGLVLPGDTSETQRVRSTILFTQAAALTNVGLLFDQGFVVTAPVAGALPVLRPYGEVIDSAMGIWDQLITLTTNKTWSWDAGWFPLSDGPGSVMTAPLLRRIANTMAARALVLSARNPTENAATDWAAVLAYADQGITGTGLTDMDFGIIDDYNVWWDYTKNYGNLDSWTRVDQRLVNRMDPDIPDRFNGITNQPVTTPNDLRLSAGNVSDTLANGGSVCGDQNDIEACIAGITTDYVDLRSVIGQVARGITKQSTFYHLRWRNNSFAVDETINIGLEAVHILAAENDLMIAEALARTNTNLTRAATLVNKTRVTRGGLTAVGAVQADLLAAIDYERDVELLNTGGISLYDRRRLSAVMFNPGTLRHAPIPAQELGTLGIALYTFGGVGLPDM